MKFNVYGHNVQFTNAMLERVEKKLQVLEKYFLIKEDTTGNLNAKTQGNEIKLEITIPTDQITLRSEVVDKDFYNAIDRAVDKLEDQIRRQKTRLNRKHKNSLSESFLEDLEDEVDVNVKTKTIFLTEMDLQEAIVQMEMLGHSFFIFKDEDTDTVSVVYKRLDGTYGVIETK